MKTNRRNFLKAVIVSPVAAISITNTQAAPTSVSETKKQSSPGTDLSLLLHCIAQVETGNDDTKVGLKGERSKYQITETVWLQHMSLDYDRCKDYYANLCARRHLIWLDRHLPRISITEVHFRDYALAWAWKGGLNSWEKQDYPYHVPWQRRVELNNYAVRVTNLYADLSPKQIS